ncbi:MAG: hypothetical protein KIT31_13235 [Deltaproteobacteria bacterium]|nr:hypothetical protein [Deltaproteobacteria bacterium]
MARRRYASDDVRLARAFGVLPTRKKGAVFTVASLGALTALTGGLWLLVPAGALALGVGTFTAVDYARIAKRLREVERWGFPVEGYRAWILAMQPAFDLELRRDVPLELFESSLTAVDDTIEVERRAGGILRVTMRRVDLPATRYFPAVEVADHRLLFEVHERVLAPLHADVGIVAMRMGERSTMTALVRSARPVADDAMPPGEGELGGGAFREPGIAAPMALQALVHQGTARLRPPSDARHAIRRRDRVLYATGFPPKSASNVLWITFAGGFTGLQLGPYGGLVGLGAGLIAGLAATLGRNAAHLRSVRNAISSAGFPIEDYEDWLISGRPIFDIEFASPPDREWLGEKLKITAYSVKLGMQLPWVEHTTWLSETVLRIETRPMLVETSEKKIESFYGGSHVLFHQLLDDVLLPLDQRTRIVAIRMGGYADRRADM